MLMPFGRYKGCPVRDLPEDYLKWLYRNVKLRGPLQSEVLRALHEPDYCDAPPEVIEPGKVKKVYRELALKWHPDRGGSTEAMKAVNEFYERLQESP